MTTHLTLEQFQREQAEWLARQPFAAGPSWHPLLGVVEEVGELSHAYLKRAQGIRGDDQTHEAKAKDAVGDVLIYLADFCSRMDFDLQQILDETWGAVKQRDWFLNPETGQRFSTADQDDNGTLEVDLPNFTD